MPNEEDRICITRNHRMVYRLRPKKDMIKTVQELMTKRDACLSIGLFPKDHGRTESYSQLALYQKMILGEICHQVEQQFLNGKDVSNPTGLLHEGLRPKTIIIDEFERRPVSSRMSQAELDVIFKREQSRVEYVCNKLDMERAEERKKYEIEILRQFRHVNEGYYKKP